MSSTSNVLALSLLISCIVQIAFGCLCKVETPEHNYCAADWVARVLVAKRQDGVRMPSGIVDRQIEQNSRHEVVYKQLFKISDRMTVIGGNQVKLPINVYTASEDAACGILLEAGHEYLLAGQYINGTMVTRLCGQILLEDLKEARKHDILEWNEVPEQIKNKLIKLEYDPVCKKAEQDEAAAEAPKNGTTVQGGGGTAKPVAPKQ